MKLLLDQNLSPGLAEALADLYPGTRHLEQLGLGSADDDQVWSHARAHGFTIVSKDFDFADISVLRGAPPQVIWIRLGNCTTSAVSLLLRNSLEAVLRFESGAETCLVLGRR